MTATTNTDVVSEIDSDLDALLADLDLDSLGDAAADILIEGDEPESIKVKNDDVLIDADVLIDDELEIEIAELLGAQEEAVNTVLYQEEDDDSEEETVSAAPKTKPEEIESNKKAAAEAPLDAKKEVSTKKKASVKKEGSAKKEAKPRTPSIAGLAKSDAIRAKLGESLYEVLILDKDMKDAKKAEQKTNIDTLVDDVDALPKKVGEKILNICQHLNSGGTLSVYSRIAFEMLFETGELSIADLRKKYEENYTKGTASAQSSQLIQVIKFLKIGEATTGKGVALNKDSLLVETLSIAA